MTDFCMAVSEPFIFASLLYVIYFSNLYPVLQQL